MLTVFILMGTATLLGSAVGARPSQPDLLADGRERQLPRQTLGEVCAVAVPGANATSAVAAMPAAHQDTASDDHET
jgi:hypothetical protein